MKDLFLVLSALAVAWAHPAILNDYARESYEKETAGNEDDTFQFAYAVASPEHGTFHGHQSTRDEHGHTSGSYYLLGADGQWRQTIYADKGLGFQAVSNQRPAGSPPSQVSAVSYQIFVHPGATAVSASGSGPIDTSSLIGRPVASAVSVTAPDFDIDTRSQGIEGGAEGREGETGGFEGGTEGREGETGGFEGDSGASAAAQSAPAADTPALTPVNVALQAAQAPAFNVQAAPPTPVSVAVQAAPPPFVNVQAARPSPVGVELQFSPSPVFNIQAATPSPINVAVRNKTPGAINVVSARPTPVNLAVRVPTPRPITVQAPSQPAVNFAVHAPAPGPITVQAPSQPVVNFAVRAPAPGPITVQAPSQPAVNFAVRAPAPRPITVQAPSQPAVNFGVRAPSAGPIAFDFRQRAPPSVSFPLRTFARQPVFIQQKGPTSVNFQGSGGQNARLASFRFPGLNNLPAGSSVVAARTLPVSSLSGGTGGSFARGIPFGTRLISNNL